eukprot:GFKZ01012392.1.p1 GENE.GFKZ01012392.1~~GFKZ01012392.1.p1  ORF type:complete len:636 (-),score=58.26 GFKZ01012392.1:562-2469(-)
MRFIPKSTRARISRRRRLVRISLLFLSRFTSILAFLALLFIFLVTSIFRSPPPAALPHASRGQNSIHGDFQFCGCIGAESCTTSVPIGSFTPPFIPRNTDDVTEKKRKAVRVVAAAAWDAYVQNAFGSDILKPISNTPLDNMGGVGATIIEALPTLYIMKLMSRYKAARRWVKLSLNFDKVRHLQSVHELTTRILGALLSAYQLTGDSLFLRKAEDLGGRLAPAFNTLNGVPYPLCNINSNVTGDDICQGLRVTQTEAGGLSLEFRALAFHSLNPSIRELRCKVDRAVQSVIEAGPDLLREEITGELLRRRASADVNGTEFTEYGEVSLRPEDNDEEEQTAFFQKIKFTSMDSYYAYMVQLWHGAISAVGAGPTVDTTATFAKPARGFYEYLTKAWRQGGGCESALRYPLDASMHMLLRRAIYQSPTGDLYLRTFDKRQNNSQPVVEQSMCYLPAVFHLAAMHKNISPLREDQWKDAAEGITKSCMNMYREFPAGLGGESARYNGKIWVTKGAYRLQADLIEALFYMWRSTRDEQYRDEAWGTFMSINRECRLANGAYTVLEEPKIGQVTKGDMMPSEFLGSTLKFLYLIFAGDDILSLDKWVFNRAGHALVVSPGIGALNPCHSELSAISRFVK